MKLHFEPKLDFQLDAIDAICSLFEGQEICRTEFTVTSAALDGMFAGFESDLGIGNRLLLLEDEVESNLQQVQLSNALAPSPDLASMDFTVEMETGTGKTYVYLRTILELNKRYGFTKFVIVVPSVAIKEGVYKTLQITRDHFRSLYSGQPYTGFIYDSKKLGEVRNFATSSEIQIMIVTAQAINKKDVNNIYKDSEKTGGEKPIDLIRATNPIIIVDEPQSVDGGLKGQGRKALEAMNPLCTLRYSATHVDKHHMVYRLDAVDAYQRKLVKQIEVASANVASAYNKPYVRLVSAKNQSGTITATVEMDVETRTGSVKRSKKTVQDGDDLEQVTGRALYEDHSIGEIDVTRGAESIELRVPGDEIWLSEGEAFGDVDETAVTREMIRRTINEHLEKELILNPKGIKVLSLFFVPSVGLYRKYDDEGYAVKGELAVMFEEEYRRTIKKPRYRTLFDDGNGVEDPEVVHDGYFAIDNRGRMLESSTGTASKDESAYNLIMRDKEKLLSFDEPLKFIFSHSALREGWDNPNVFQICTLRDVKSERQRRQTIGRGLRLAVNQDGERQRGFGINRLTVIAQDSYEQFAKDLQLEIQADTGIRFGVVLRDQFAACSIQSSDGEFVALGAERSEELWAHFNESHMIDAKGNVLDALRDALREESLDVPESFQPYLDQIAGILTRLAGTVEVRDADERKQIRPRRAVLDSPEFKELWDRVKQKTTYRVHFDNEKLIVVCIEAVSEMPVVPKTTLQWKKAKLDIRESGVAAEETRVDQQVTLDEPDIPLPDVLTELQDRTQLTRRTITRILIESERLDDFVKNPQKYIDMVSELINRKKRIALVDGIKYQRLGDDEYYAQELFEEEELTGYIKNMLKDAQRSVYEAVVYDSATERKFAEDLEKREGVKVYAKLPGWFTIPTPLGSYNPDWAVLVDTDEGERLYFVVETKSSLFEGDLREAETAKIKCGEAHFAALADMVESPAKFVKATNLDEVLA
ncbi:MAG: DEAD/DEAH box helicase family protein [Candidatus Paceibacterota bacterium]